MARLPFDLPDLSRFRRIKWIALWLLGGLLGTSLVSCGALFLYVNPQIPEAESYRHYRYETPLRILARDGELIAEFGTRRLNPIALEDVPQQYIDAVIATEDKRFYSHGGIDWLSFANDVFDLLGNPEVKRGASTITMQLPRNVADLTREQTLVRKVKEMLLALKIEGELTKDEILELYINIIPFGKHSYGLKAAAYTYYEKHPRDLNLAQLAMLAGIPKRPEAGNPINGPEYALGRRNLVLRRMLTEDKITRAEFDDAVAQPITATVFHRELELDSPYPAEMVRRELIEMFGSDIYTGYAARTTIDVHHQRVAQSALRRELENYDRQYGYRGPALQINLEETDPKPLLKQQPNVSGFVASVVVEVGEDYFVAQDAEQDEYRVEWEGIRWARPYSLDGNVGARPREAGEVVAVGDIVRVREVDGVWHLSQVPDVSGALVALHPLDGSISALVGGFSFNANQFNHVTQARRQPGSGFKPFVYSAALQNGDSPASIYLDAPLVFDDDSISGAYRPQNDTGRYRGQLRLREALYRSVNLISIRVLTNHGAQQVIDWATHFGFDPDKLPNDTQLAIGGGTFTATPMEMANAYAVLANGGFEIEPHLILDVLDRDNEVIYKPVHPVVCADCSVNGEIQAGVTQFAEVVRDDIMSDSSLDAIPEETLIADRVIDERNVFLMNSMLRDVIRRGTGARAYRELQRDDLAGKTGTTDEATDTWFNGFHPELVVSTWVGFSEVRSLGKREWGSTRPLGIWIEFMREALKDVPDAPLHPPEGIVRVRIDRKTGLFTDADNPDAIFEYFRSENSPVLEHERTANNQADQLRPEEIF